VKRTSINKHSINLAIENVLQKNEQTTFNSLQVKKQKYTY